jgi:hypothetical protein
MGGLGNQLFQIFATISYAIKSRNQFKFHNVETLGGGSCTLRYTFWNSFLSRFKPFLINSIPQPIHVIREKDFTYNELPIHEMINNNTLLFGYFQSYKYFQENYVMICKIIGLDNLQKSIVAKIGLDRNYLENCVSMHFRIGDYKNLQQYHPVLGKEYYYNCLQFIKNKFPDKIFIIMYFCEEVDVEQVSEIINYLQESFIDFQFVRGEKDLEDWQQMLLMSCCHHNIIANSSFSWWAAYFNNWSDKVVCYPSVWFGPSGNHDLKDLHPTEWNKIHA